jgi:hypothetical protein
MSDATESLDQRRAHLIAEIARQRGELAVSYKNIAKPIQYFEYGMRGFGLLRQNPWIFSVVPAAVTITTALVGAVRTPKPAAEPKLSMLEKITRSRAARKAEKIETKAQKSLLGHAMHWGGRGLKFYRVYKKVRKFL